MYKDQGGKKITLQGIDCYLPPEPPLHQIQGSHLPKKKQKWYRTELPKFPANECKIWSGTSYTPSRILTWDELRREETIKQTGHDPWELDSKGKPVRLAKVDADLSYVDPKLEAFRVQEFGRIQNGHWFMLCGEPTYLTGPAYMYFNWWKIDIGHPDYRHYITIFSYVVEAVRYDPTKVGVLLASMRGVGKTNYGNCVCYTVTILKKGAHSGMQSKTDDDAEGMFNKMAVSVNSLPEFLIPINSWGRNVPKEKLEFYPQKAAHPNGLYDKYLRESALMSFIDYKNSKDGAYDSSTCTVLLQDEIGKITKAIGNVKTRFDVAQFCVLRGTNKRGFILGFTTIGEMDNGGGKQFKELYYDSDPSKAINGWTSTGCVRYFISALEASVYDEYGRSDIEASRQFHADRKASILRDCEAKGDYSPYIAYCQQNPESEEEAFMINGSECIFNATVLKDRQFICSRPEFVGITRGDLEWDVKWKTVKFVPNHINGLWGITFDPEEYEQYLNKAEVTEILPGKYNVTLPNSKYFTIGMDPTSHRKVQDQGKASKPAITVRANEWFTFKESHSNTPIAHYVGRIESVKEQAEDCIKACLYFGVQVLLEKNKSNVGQYIEDWGFFDILERRPGAQHDDWGISSGPAVIEQYVGLAKDDINDNGRKLRHLPIIENALEFNANNTTKFDSFVSYALSLISAQKQKRYEPEGDFDINTMFPTFNHSGSVAKRN